VTLYDLLRVKGTEVFTISPNETLDDAVQKLVECNCGSLVVCEGTTDGGKPQMVGIITERDILRTCAARRGPLEQQLIADVMSTDLSMGKMTDSVERTMGLMTERRIRHLPIIEEEELVGIISIGDVVKAQYHMVQTENHYLKRYIQG
jgi:CBS domain-containing protein